MRKLRHKSGEAAAVAERVRTTGFESRCSLHYEGRQQCPRRHIKRAFRGNDSCVLSTLREETWDCVSSRRPLSRTRIVRGPSGHAAHLIISPIACCGRVGVDAHAHAKLVGALGVPCGGLRAGTPFVSLWA